MISCDNSGIKIDDQFAEVGKLITHAKGGKRKIVDYKLTRYACYMIVQNSDPRKKVIVLGQTYFAIQTRRQEVRDYFEKLDENKKRLVVRGDIKQWNQMLFDTAHNAGVITEKEFAIFQNAGYIGLYGGETVEDIHKRKGLKEKEKILDYMNSQELIANLFRISLADEKIKKEKVSNKDDATLIHNKVGQEVRNAIKRVGGVLPENQPTPEKSIYSFVCFIGRFLTESILIMEDAKFHKEIKKQYRNKGYATTVIKTVYGGFKEKYVKRNKKRNNTC